MPKKILLVDDEADIAESVKLRLEASGFQVVLATDGQQALDLTRKEMPDLIILDLMLPKIDGYKVCRMLKFDDKYKRIPIFMFTARAQESDQKLGLEVGADAYIMKPFELKTLVEKIKETLEAKQEEK